MTTDTSFSDKSRLKTKPPSGFIGSLRSPWILEEKFQALESPWKQSRSLKVLEFEFSIFGNFCILKFILVKFGISPLLGYSSLAYLKNFPMCITYNLFVYIFQNSFKCYVTVVTVRIWYVFLSILLVLENCNFRSLRSPWILSFQFVMNPATIKVYIQLNWS